MQLYIKQKVFSWKDKFNIVDKNNEMVYYCEGKVFSLGKKLTIYNNLGTPVAYIEQELFRLFPRYKIYINDTHHTTIIKKFRFFSHAFEFSNHSWRIEGNFIAYNYQILDGEKAIITIQKKWLSWGDAYCLDISDNYDCLLAVCASIVIDCACHSNNKN